MSNKSTISVQIVKGLSADCHFTTLPVCPDKVNNELVVPEQIVDPPVTIPPTLATSMVTVVAAEFSSAQLPF